MKVLPLSQVVNKGIQQLSSLQEKDGSFLSFSSPNEHDFTDATAYPTTFLSSIILLSTESLSSGRKILYVRKKLADFLLLQKSVHWSWNYWNRGSQEAKKLPYPDDLDDTFCALAALANYDKKIISGDVFAHIVNMLTLTEAKEGGPYRTWLVAKKSSKHWTDIDFAVNSNIAFFLSLYDIYLPNLQNYFDVMIEKQQITSRYYPSFYTSLFFLARFYQGKHKNLLKDMLLKKKDKNGCFENPLKTALAIITLLKLEVDPEKVTDSIIYLLKTHKNGLWPAYGFCIDPSKNGVMHFAGSPALTTAICLQALQKYHFVQKDKIKLVQRASSEKEEKNYYYNEIISQVTKHFNSYGKEVSEKGEIVLHKIQKNDIFQQIPLLPYFFFKSLYKNTKKITKTFLIKLGVANVLGWIAYTIFDDFFDEEGDPSFLPLAIVSLRQLTSILDTFTLRKKRIQKLYHTVMNTVDSANAEELRRRSFTNYTFDKKDIDHLADKSIGHALGPLAIIILLGYTQESKEFKNMLLFFNHYLVAKQLNDDAHDWEEDLHRKHITPVVALILIRAQEKKIRKTRRNLQEFFWKEIIQEVCGLIHRHARKAKMALKKSTLIADPTYLEKLLEAPVKAAEKALEEQKNVKSFLKTYQA